MDKPKEKEGMITLVCDGQEKLPRIAREVISAAGQDRVWVLEGEMGAGKTTFIKALAAEYGVTDTVSSPTYSLVNEYGNEAGDTFYHFDLYRIEDQEEAQDIGISEYFHSGDICWVEWPSKIPDLLPDRYFKITIFVSADDSRMFQLSHHE